ncbi:carboxypeptidase-like regulatory domain-containing protein [Altibacter sp. HG106]|uniref:carboxypeptidase-like regulatory domain-containing protein n=1 Tax=Altibacter sp. HG106 TaxID=3023937 RepID=UPI00235029F9|nr:carboxypeptidase-like regulatory domain-containing protein [Altibacter sp. HG106]MDC7995665.1 carboxypeptidase-like regulatory domain-containing protein [Altibacter sp. HG106]
MKTAIYRNPVLPMKSLFLGMLTLMTFLITSEMTAQDQKRTVTGIVKSTDGPVFGATVVLKGTAIGVATDDKGAFTFPEKLSDNDVLVVSFLGYQTAEVRISEETTFVTPFLADDPVIIKTALRTRSSKTTAKTLQK